MRNLKRALSLALASVMLLGMMVVGTSAASYPDIDENDNVEAIEVLNAVNVMIGRQGNFEPDEAVNRHEMAVIMAKLVLGVEIADNYVGTHPFTDVVPWADKYVAACYENGLVAGTSATTYGGSAPLSAVQAAAMMLRALGYKDLSVGAKDWRAPVTAMANQIRLFNGVASNPSEQLNRNQVAQLALNTLKSPMVNLKDNTISWTDGEGQVIITGGDREYIALSSNEAYAKAINDTERAGTSASQISGYTVELGEHLYNGKLKLNNNNLDVFGRPSRKWEFDGKEIGSYVKEELMVMDKVGKVTGNDLYTLLGASTIKDYDTLVTIDGVANDRSDAKDILGYPNGAYFDEADMNRNNKAAVGKTGTGVLTQVFVDHEKDEVYVAVINTYLARADRDYDDKSEEATLTVYGIDEYRTDKEYAKLKGTSETMKVQAEDFAGLETIEKGDPFLVTVADGAIQTMVEDEVLEGVTLTAFKKGDHVVSDGTEYTYTTTATYDSATLDVYTGNGTTNLKDITYNIYLDAYGNLIGIKEVDAVKNYVFLAGIDVDGSNLYSKTATANALFLDGTSKTIKINLAKSKWTTHDALNNTNVVISGDALLNTWCTYTVGSDNVYTVTEVYATRVNPDHPSIKDIKADPNNYPGGGKNNTKLAQSWQPAAGLNEDNYTVDVKRMRLHGTTNNSDGSAYANVYGDSTSVYLTANLDELFNDSKELNVGRSYGIIKDVDAVTTGVADVSIKVMTKEAAQKAADDAGKLDSQKVDDTAYGIYTLYDNEGIVIASVVIGEDDGVKDLVYVHTSTLDLESYNSTDDIWTWTRRVVFNGQETTLTEKGSEYSEMKPMKQFHWYEIKRNADGNVINVEPAYSALDDAFVYEYSKINTTVETVDEDTILYQTEDGPLDADDNGAVTGHDHYGFYKEKLNVIGTNTLAVETLSGSGIHFRDNVNVVLQYWNRNTEQTEIETGTGVDRLKSMVDFVNKNTETRDSAHPYYLSAVIEKGFATTIVIYDSFNSYNRPDAPAGNYELTLGGVLNSIYTTSANLNSDVYIVNSDGSISYVESNDDVATSTVNGYKRYTVPYGAKIRVYDNDVADADFQPFFSPIKALSDYHYYENTTARRAYFEFTVPAADRLENDKLTIRERMVTDGIYVGVEKDAKATITVGTKTYKAGESVVVYDGQTVTANTTAADAKLYVNGIEYAAPYTWKVDVDKDLEFIIGTTGGTVTPPDPTDPEMVTVTFKGTAVKDNHYTLTGLNSRNQIEAGETFTVNANKKIAVYVDGERVEVAANTSEPITATKNVTVVINRFTAQFVGDILTEVEKTDADTPTVASVASMARFSRAARADEYKLISLDGQFAPTDTYVVKVVANGYQFGKNTTPAMRDAIEEAFDKADLANTDIEISVLRNATETEIAAWKGETPVVPGEDAKLEELLSDTGKTQYIVQHHGPKSSIDFAQLLKDIQADGGFTSATWNAQHDKLTVTRTDGGPTTVPVTYQAKTAIYYNGTIIQWTDKGKAGAQDIGVGKFSKGAKLIGSTDKDIVAVNAAPTSVVAASATEYKLSIPVANADNYYLKDAYEVTWGAGVGAGKGALDASGVVCKDESGKTLFTNETGTFAVAKDEKVNLAVTGGQTTNFTGETYHLRANKDVLKSVTIGSAAGVAQKYEVTVSSANTKDGVIAIGEYGPICTVKLSDSTEVGYGYLVTGSGETVELKAEAGAAYIKATSAPGTPQMFASAATAVADSDGVLKYQVKAADVDEVGGYTITLNRAYKLEWGTDVANAKVLKGEVNSAEYTAASAATNGDYVVPGKAVVVAAQPENTTLTSPTGKVTLTKVDELTTNVGAGDKYFYSFIMPTRDVKAEDIAKSGTEIKTSLAITDQTYSAAGNTLNEVGGYANGIVTLTGNNLTVAPPTNAKIEWFKGEKWNTAEKMSSAPANMAAPEWRTSSKAGEWTLLFWASDEKVVTPGTYWFEITIDGAKAHQKLVVDKVTAGTSSPKTANIVSAFETSDKVALGAATEIDANLTLENGQTLDTNKFALTLTNGITVKSGATLKVDTVASGSGKVKLDGGTLVIGGSMADISSLNLDTDSKGTLVIDSDARVDGIWKWTTDGADDNTPTTINMSGNDPVEIGSGNVYVSGLTMKGGDVNFAGSSNITERAEYQFNGSEMKVYTFIFDTVRAGWTVEITIKSGSVEKPLNYKAPGSPDTTASADGGYIAMLSDKVESITFTFTNTSTGAVKTATYQVK